MEGREGGADSVVDRGGTMDPDVALGEPSPPYAAAAFRAGGVEIGGVVIVDGGPLTFRAGGIGIPLTLPDGGARGGGGAFDDCATSAPAPPFLLTHFLVSVS